MDILSAIHAAGVVHRDPRWPNLLLSQADGSPRIVDFDRAMLSEDEAARMNDLDNLLPILENM